MKPRKKPVFIIAEIGMNHNGSVEMAELMIDAAAGVGVSAVKFQTHIADAETLENAPAPAYFMSEPRYDFFKRTAFSLDTYIGLKEHADKKGVDFISSPFSLEAVDLLENVGIETYKIPSGEVTNIPLIQKVARTGKAILLSSGMSNFPELDEAVQTILAENSELTVMQCSSQYPCPYEEAGLNVILQMKERYSLPVGFSDHTPGIAASLAAVALGATAIEKHFTMSTKLYGPDAKFSLEPGEFRQMVDGIRQVEIMLSHPVDKNDITKYREMKHIFEKSIVSCADIPRGTEIKPEMIGLKKPGGGLNPRYYYSIIGKTAKNDIPKNTPFAKGDINW